MKHIDGYWVDENGNRWSDIYSESQAEKYSKTMIGCHDCYNCRDCYYCSLCDGCLYCTACYVCCGCSNCANCVDCVDCSSCDHCYKCSNCSHCRSFSKNPQRIVSGEMGSRNGQTIVYYDGEITQVVCGCFRGNMDDFERKVEEYHKNIPEYLGEYRDFIKRVRDFWGLKKEDER